ncbi:FecR domain-containing protein [Pseudomonas sp. 3A(2025)]
MPAHESPISREVAKQAAHWLMLMHDGPLSASQQQACERWRSAEPEHERAWQRVQRIQQQLGVLPPHMAMGTLNRQRRQTLKTLLVLAAVLPAGYLGYRATPWREWTADYRTAVGERRQIELADGSLLDLNTDTAIDVQFSADQRLIRLLRGELLITSGADRNSPVHRPLRVTSQHGQMQALGTRFSVRQLEAQTRLAVFEGQVRVTPLSATPAVIGAGEQVSFNASGIGPKQIAFEQDNLWSKGQLIADDMPLDNFLRELSRYRPGLLRCDPSARGLRISGGFQLDNTDAILAALPTTLPVQVESRTRYWITVNKK